MGPEIFTQYECAELAGIGNQPWHFSATGVLLRHDHVGLLTFFEVPLPSVPDGKPLTPAQVGRIVSKIGRKAGVVVSREMGWVREPILDDQGNPTGETRLVEKEVAHFAGPHDLRRAFCSRWARKVMPAVLQQLARHRHISTTMKYYVRIRADEVAADLWSQFGSGSGSENDRLGTILGTTAPNDAQNANKGSEQAYPKPLASKDF